MASVGIVHISDMHLGASISGHGGLRIFPAATAHDEDALNALYPAISKIFASEQYPLGLVISGDVSAWGSAAELRMYLTLRDLGYPRHRLLALPPLIKDFDTVLDIPGNHDYWDGNVLLHPWVNQATRGFFPRQPWHLELRTTGHLVSISGVCSTFAASGNEQLSAVGRFQGVDLRLLESSLASADADAQREKLKSFKLIVTHHSPSYGSDTVNGLSTESIADLSQLCLAKDVKGLLTGHVHASGVAGKRSLPPPKNLLPVETRCGTTTQGDWLRLKWLSQG
jgi:3',5'-cyclic AMP phosphodiesterase CpdA